MRILVLGSSGMLGHVVVQYFSEQGYQIGTVARTKNSDYNLDVCDNMEGLEDIFNNFKPEVVINCIGILNKVAEDNKYMAVKLNSLLPHYIDMLSLKYNFKFIHVSTDCVFEGIKGNYIESDYKDATSFYGQSKALGEINNNYNLTLRTSIVGPDINENGIGLFNWFMKQEVAIGGYTRVVWTGVTTIELAKCMEIAIKNNLTALYHVCNNETINKYDLCQLFNQYFNKNLTINKNDSVISNKSIINTSDFDFGIPSYEKMIKEMKEWIDNHKEIYPNYLRKKL